MEEKKGVISLSLTLVRKVKGSVRPFSEGGTILEFFGPGDPATLHTFEESEVGGPPALTRNLVFVRMVVEENEYFYEEYTYSFLAWKPEGD